MDNRLVIPYRTYAPLTELPPEDMQLVLRAREACETSFAPYSEYRVGTAALLRSGRIISASNQESPVFPAGLCAERALLFAHMNDAPHDFIVAMAIASSPGDRECYPCGLCRQTILDTIERQGATFRIIMSGDDSATVVDDAVSLLPFSFKL